MSFRHLKKVFGGDELPPPDESDEDYEPPYAKNTGHHKFDGFVISSCSESEEKTPDDIKADDTACNMVKKKKKNKKKKKGKDITNPKQKQETYQAAEHIDLDEIDRSVLEVNKLLGAASIAPSTSKNVTSQIECNAVMIVHQRHLTVTTELKRMFGSEVTEENRVKNRGQQSIMDRLSRKMYLVQPKPFLLKLTKLGLSMSVNRREEGLTYFTYDHDGDYQKFHKDNLVSNIVLTDLSIGLNKVQKKMYVEGLITAIDSLFQMEQNTLAVQLLETTVAYLQLTAHPSFSLYDPKCRLEYKYTENRPFFIVMLKYIHYLTNTACHRTALELAKVLLILEPSDPVAVLLIIDIIALRAREHQWLIDAVDYWKQKRYAGTMLNMQYSYALSHFHVLTKKNEDLAPADALLREAILNFPTVAYQLMQMTSIRADDSVKGHPFYNAFANATTPKVIKELSQLYAKFTCHKWREPPVLKWFTWNIKQLLEDYKTDPSIQEAAKKAGSARCNMFQEMPRQITRHLIIIKSMAALLIDDGLPSSVPSTLPWNPLPDTEMTVNRYYTTNTTRQVTERDTTALLELIRSFAPGFSLEQFGNHDLRAAAMNEVLGRGIDEAADAFDLELPSDSDN